MRSGGWLLAVLLVTSGLAAGVPFDKTIEVVGVDVPARGIDTVREALSAAHVEVGSGRFLGAVSGRELPRATPGQVFVDGRLASLDSRVRAGDVIAVVPGVDQREPIVAVDVAVPSHGDAVLYVGGKPASARVLRGALSGEMLSRRLVRGPIRGHLVTPGAIALTFDDGPDPRWTPRILSMLARWHVHAVFCVVGRHVDEHPDLVRRIVAGGNLLCNHTYDHDEALGSRPLDVRVAQIARTQAAVLRATGQRPVFFRSPGGFWNARIVAAARAQGLVPLKWNADTRDWTRPGTRKILRTLLSELKAGRIVLFHDGGGDRRQSVQAVGWALHELPKRGYRFAVPSPPP